MTAESVTLITYGSLMSGYGLARLGPVSARALSRVSLHNARRGFGKLSQYGDHFAMVLDAVNPRQPMVATPLAADADADGVPDAFAITLSIADLLRISVREGYAADAMRALGERADGAGQSLGSYLWSIAIAHDCDPVAYRRALYRLIGYTSPHYIPHPIARDDAEPALVFLASGREGSGCDDVVPVRVRSGMTDVLSLRRAWQRKPTPSQATYIVMCLLAHVHGVRLADVLDGLDDDDSLRTMLDERLAGEVGVEPQRFCQALSLSRDDYHRAVGVRKPPPLFATAQRRGNKIHGSAR